MIGRRADVVRAIHDAVQLDDRVFENRVVGVRLVGEYVQSDPQALLAYGLGQCLMVHYLGARGVDEVSTGLHCGEERFTDKLVRIGIGGEMY